MPILKAILFARGLGHLLELSAGFYGLVFLLLVAGTLYDSRTLRLIAIGLGLVPIAAFSVMFLLMAL